MPQTCPKCQRATPPRPSTATRTASRWAAATATPAPSIRGRGRSPCPSSSPTVRFVVISTSWRWPATIRGPPPSSCCATATWPTSSPVSAASTWRGRREAARESDKDRALDQLLGQLPANTIEPARLQVETLHVNLGQLTVGKDHRFDLRLANQGMRMLSGTVAVDDCTWLALGEGGGSPRKVFQFQTNTSIPVQVRGKLLRAAVKPIQGRLVLETNGGAATVVVTADVPVQPFAEGVLAGAITPRQIAEKAKKAPRDAAPLFESGAVARWYIRNGWTYPVQGPAASGIGAVQQFFEALGLTHPPKVAVRESSLAFEGKPGAGVFHTLDVFTAEKRPIFASAVSDASWLKVRKVALNGNTAHVQLAVDPVPDRPGESLQANVTVRANGNQRFVVPVSLRVVGKPRTVAGGRGRDGVFPALEVVEVTDPYDAAPPLFVASAAGPPPVRRIADTVRPSDYPRLAETMRSPAGARPPAVMEAIPLDDDDRDAPERKPSGGGAKGLILPLLPVAFILIGLLVTVVRDGIVCALAPRTDPGGAGTAGGPSGPPLIDVQFHDQNVPVKYGLVEMKPQGGDDSDGAPAVWEPSMRFGLTMTRAADPQGQGVKKLTYDENGLTNNTCVQLDGEQLLFGETGTVVLATGQRVLGFRGKWKEMETDLGNDAQGVKRRGKRSVWTYDREKVDVTQTVEIVGGEQSNRYDTCLVTYHIENRDGRPHRVGLRFLLDTYIGANDGVPFLIPGQNHLCDTQEDLQGDSVPQFIQAIETQDRQHPGTIARLQLKVGGVEPPNRVTLGAYPAPKLAEKTGDRRCRQQDTMWEVPVYDMSIFHDSAVTMYWDPKPLAAGKSRDVGFAYGLGDVAASEGGGLRLTTGGDFSPGGEFTVAAEVGNPTAGQTVTLTLPTGFQVARRRPDAAGPGGGRGRPPAPRRHLEGQGGRRRRIPAQGGLQQRRHAEHQDQDQAANSLRGQLIPGRRPAEPRLNEKRTRPTGPWIRTWPGTARSR